MASGAFREERIVFDNIPKQIQDRMAYLAGIDERDRTDGRPRLEKLRQIPEETGRFIAILAASSPPGRWIEIGTSAGYSTLWLALACRPVGQKLQGPNLTVVCG